MEINLRENKNGITLITLVITIIVLLILAGVSITTLTGENGILNRATNAREVNDKASAKEEIQLGVMASYGVDGNVDNELIKENLSKISGITGIPDSITDESYPVEVTVDGKTFEIGKSGTVHIPNYKSVSEVFDANGKDASAEEYDASKLHIGDFVNYDAGTWTAEEISSIKTGKKGSEVTANGNTSLPKSLYQFGGFTAGSSRNGNATPNTAMGLYNYAKDESGNVITGWRVFDVDGNNVILISAGCPEDYYHVNDAYGGEYILTGNIPSSISEDNYTNRDWSMYKAEKAEEVKALARTTLESWYKKYQIGGSIYNISTIQGTKYESVLDNYSNYWLFTAASNYFPYVYPKGREIEWLGNGKALGVRILITLSNVQLAKTTETKTVSSPNYSAQTYSVWNYK